MPESDFKDHFSGHAGAYARARPGYPEALFDWLGGVVSGHALAWDVGTGNGQAARGLAAQFAQVHATDASAEQIAEASGPDTVRFLREPAEACSLGDGEVDLVTVGQAMHWFDLPAFYAEVKRVLRPRGVLAAWTYQLNEIEPAVDALIRDFFDNVIGPYWPPERVHVEAGYQDLPFPFREISTPDFALVSHWTLDDYLAYMDTWSAVRRYRANGQGDPLPELRETLLLPWGGTEQRREVCWPLALRAGTVPSGE